MDRKSMTEVEAVASAELQFDQLELGQAFGLHRKQRGCIDVALVCKTREKIQLSEDVCNHLTVCPVSSPVCEVKHEPPHLRD